MTVTIARRHDITLEAVRRIAWRGEGVALAPEALAAMEAARERFMQLIEEPDVVIYGVTSGYGQNAKVRLGPDERKTHARRPPAAAAASWGDPLPERVTRAMVLARLANFVEGHAAVSPHVAAAVAAMLDGRPLPQVPARGQGGAGEILSLSHLFLDLARSLELGEKDALSLVNGSPAASALIADAALAAGGRLDLCAEVFALAAEGFNVPLSHFSPHLDDFWNNRADAWALARLRGLIGPGHGGARRPYQAPVSFRILPRILGQARRALLFAEEVAEESLAAVSDNPVVTPPDAAHPLGEAISTGGYHNAQAVMALDMLTQAAANLTIIAERLSAKLLDPAVSLLPAQLGGGDGRAYLGCLPMAITGYEEEARLLCQATLLPGSESGGFGQNDVASPVFLAWSKQERAGILLESSLAALAPIALRAFDVTGRPVPEGLTELARLVAETVPDTDGQSLGPPTAALAAKMRERVYG
jgi:histidine ammonia-lyase